jgi:sec-independent protein translocase protein TatB
MELFNVNIVEVLIIAGLALVVFGPERLPEVGRFLGKQVARLLAWQQQSPELQMLNDVRGEFEREIASLRDELVRTRKQLDVSDDLTAIRNELRPMLDLRGSLNGAAAQPEPQIAPPRPAAEAAEPLADSTSPAEAAAEPAPLSPAPAAQTVPAAVRPNKIVAAEPTRVLSPAAPAAPADQRELGRRLQQLMADMQALVSELQERGQLGPDWQPPSQMADQETISR